MRHLVALLAALVSWTQLPANGAAQEPSTDDGWTYPTRYAVRPLVLQRGMLRADLAAHVKAEFGSDNFVSVDFGMAIAPANNLEIGLSAMRTGSLIPDRGQGLIPIVIAPDNAFGDIPLYGRYQFVKTQKIALAVDTVLTIPVEGDFAVLAGLPLRVFELFGLFTLDMELQVRLRSLGNGVAIDLELPGGSTLNITDNGFIKIGGAFKVTDLAAPAPADVRGSVNLLVGGGFSKRVGDTLLIDAFVAGGWDPITTFNPPTGRNAFELADTWYVIIGTNIHTGPLFN